MASPEICSGRHHRGARPRGRTAAKRSKPSFFTVVGDQALAVEAILHGRQLTAGAPKVLENPRGDSANEGNFAQRGDLVLVDCRDPRSAGHQSPVLCGSARLDRLVVAVIRRVASSGRAAAANSCRNALRDRKSTRLNSSHEWISYAV